MADPSSVYSALWWWQEMQGTKISPAGGGATRNTLLCILYTGSGSRIGGLTE